MLLAGIFSYFFLFSFLSSTVLLHQQQLVFRNRLGIFVQVGMSMGSVAKNLRGKLIRESLLGGIL